MKILYIERSLRKGLQVFDQIRRIGHHITTHTLAFQMGDCPDLHEENITSIRCSFFPKLERVKQWMFGRTAMKGFQKLSGNRTFDLIHAHFAYPEGAAAQLIGRRFGIPYVVTGRGSDVLIYPNNSKYLRRSISRVLRNSAMLVAVSEHIRSCAVRLGAKPERCVVIPDGIPEDIFFQKPVGEVSRDSRLILFVGSFIPVKNVKRMIDAFGIVVSREPNVRFQFVGRGALEAEMQAQVRELGIGERCEFLGHLNHMSLAEVMRSAHVLCLPSLSEGWPNVVMEAMACGTPVVGANVGGIPEQIISEDYGLLCDPYSSNDIAEKLLLALNREWGHGKIHERGSIYTRDDSAQKILEVYGRILGTE